MLDSKAFDFDKEELLEVYFSHFSHSIDSMVFFDGIAIDLSSFVSCLCFNLCFLFELLRFSEHLLFYICIKPQ
jgi:hypothetical protein